MNLRQLSTKPTFLNRPTVQIQFIAILIACLSCCRTYAQDWGAYSLIPASAPAMVLEAVGSGTADETIVSIGRPDGTANQKWVVVPKRDGFFAIKPLYGSKL